MPKLKDELLKAKKVHARKVLKKLQAQQDVKDFDKLINRSIMQRQLEVATNG